MCRCSLAVKVKFRKLVDIARCLVLSKKQMWEVKWILARNILQIVADIVKHFILTIHSNLNISWYNFLIFATSTVLQGLANKFREKDRNFSGSAKLTYDDFMEIVLHREVWTWRRNCAVVLWYMYQLQKNSIASVIIHTP